jgi:hypothetical protein
MDLSNSLIGNNVILDPSKNLLMEQEKLKQLYLQHQQEKINRIKIESIKMICRQTDYTEEEAREKLEKNNYNYQIVLNEYFGIKEPPKKEQSTNQQIYGEIRNLMDTGAKRFREEQERAKAYQEYIEKQKKSE